MKMWKHKIEECTLEEVTYTDDLGEKVSIYKDPEPVFVSVHELNKDDFELLEAVKQNKKAFRIIVPKRSRISMKDGDRLTVRGRKFKVRGNVNEYRTHKTYTVFAE